MPHRTAMSTFPRQNGKAALGDEGTGGMGYVLTTLSEDPSVSKCPCPCPCCYPCIVLILVARCRPFLPCWIASCRLTSCSIKGLRSTPSICRSIGWLAPVNAATVGSTSSVLDMPWVDSPILAPNSPGAHQMPGTRCPPSYVVPLPQRRPPEDPPSTPQCRDAPLSALICDACTFSGCTIRR